MLAYGYQVVMARLLRPEEYAGLTAFFAVLILEQTGGQVVQAATARLVAQHAAHGDDPALHSFVRRWTKRILLLGGIPALVVIVAVSGVLRDEPRGRGLDDLTAGLLEDEHREERRQPGVLVGPQEAGHDDLIAVGEDVGDRRRRQKPERAEVPARDLEDAGGQCLCEWPAPTGSAGACGATARKLLISSSNSGAS